MLLALYGALCPAVTAAPATDYDPLEVLRRVWLKASAATDRAPNYTCVETVDREFYSPADSTIHQLCANAPALRQVMKDRLRMDVTLTEQREVYSWVGAGHFEEEGITAVVRQGPISSGVFAGYLILIFREDVKDFAFVRRFEENGRVRMEYSFRVPAASSHYFVEIPGDKTPTSYQGTFVADAETSEIVRINLQTPELPVASGNCRSDAVVDLSRVRIGDGEYLLPAMAQQRFVHPAGGQTKAIIHFDHCREYRGESTLRFFEDGETVEMGRDAKRKAQAPEAEAPEAEGGLEFRFATDAPIDSRRAAAGDPFSGKLVQPLRDSQGKVLAPKGAQVSGRLLRVQLEQLPKPQTVIVMQPRMIGRMTVRAVLADRKAAITLPLQGEEYTGLFRFRGKAVVVPAGFASTWQTRTTPQWNPKP